MNKVILIGRLTSDPSLSYTQTTQTAVAAFRLAVNRDTRNGGADFIQCKVFGKQAENLHQYKGKGDEIAVDGRIETGSYDKSDGTTVYTTEVVCNRIEYTHGSKGNSEPRASEEPEQSASYSEPSINNMMGGELPDSFEAAEDDIPF